MPLDVCSVLKVRLRKDDGHKAKDVLSAVVGRDLYDKAFDDQHFPPARSPANVEQPMGNVKQPTEDMRAR
jgi:hypothetical protein